jgi:WD40 repeat protein
VHPEEYYSITPGPRGISVNLLPPELRPENALIRKALFGLINGLRYTGRWLVLQLLGAFRSAGRWVASLGRGPASRTVPLLSVTFSPTGTSVWGLGDTILAHIFVGQGEPIWRERPEAMGGRSIALGKGNHLAIGREDGSVWLQRLSEGATGKEINAHGGRVNSVAFSPNGRILATAGDDGSVCLWEVPSGSPLRSAPFRVPEGEVRNVVFSADGKHIAAGASVRSPSLFRRGSGMAVVWRLDERLLC